MIESSLAKEAFNVFVGTLGQPLAGLWAVIFGAHLINCLITQFFGMKKLDMLFDGKVYNDTFSRGLHVRYFCHCFRYMCGDVSVEGRWMKLWLRVSVIGEMTLVLSVLILFGIWGYLALTS